MSSNKKIEEIINIIFPKIKFSFKNNVQYQPLSTNIISLFYIMILDIIVLPFLMVFGIPLLLINIFIALSIILLVVLYYFKRVSINKNYLLVTTGIFIKKISLVFYNKVEYIKVTQGPISNLMGTAKLDLYIMSGLLDIKHSLGYVNLKDIVNIRKKYLYKPLKHLSRLYRL